LHDKKGNISRKIYIIPALIIGVIFILIAIYTIDSIEDYYHNLKMGEAASLARGYSHNIQKSLEADDIISKLLEDKIRVALKAVESYENISNDLLIELADTLEVDEIDLYNSQGAIIYSNLMEVLGWQVYEGHPIDTFLESNEIMFIEDIRQDVITGNYFKYGYLKFPDNSLIQVGVRAERVHEFLQQFEMDYILDEMALDDNIHAISLIDRTGNVMATTIDDLKDHTIETGDIIDKIGQGREFYVEPKYFGESDIYVIFVPITIDGSLMGSLAVSYSFLDTVSFVRTASYIAITALVLIYIALGFVVFTVSKNNKKLYEVAYFDNLTNLPNLLNLKKSIESSVEEKNIKKAMLLVNITGFKLINLTFGYNHGDKVLLAIANKLKLIEEKNIQVFRFDADRFVVYVGEYGNKEDLKSIANKVRQLFSNPLIVDKTQHYINEQVGIMELGDETNSMDEIIKDLSLSLNHIRINREENYVFFNQGMEDQFRREEAIEKELRRVLGEESNNFYLHYQPIIDLKTGQIAKLEALARLKVESIDYVAPPEFIDIAERKQLIVPLGNEVIRRVSKCVRELKEKGYELPISINISGMQILRDDFIETIIRIIEEEGSFYSNIELEITETVLLEGYDLINEKLKELKRYGFKIALDDFGTGYSSFYRLRELNVDTLKIDKYFIDQILTREEKDLVSGDIISMAHKFNIKVVAEGVEEKVQQDYLIKQECDYMQGYFFSKPLPFDQILDLFEQQSKKRDEGHE
jgi:diguanylate cyclase (GGDEF)-like protein